MKDLRKAAFKRFSDQSTSSAKSLANPRSATLRSKNLLYAILLTSRKLRHYFQSHTIKVVSSAPLGEILRNRDANGRIVKWAIELGAFSIEFPPKTAIKSQTLADFMAEWTKLQDPRDESEPDY